MAECRDKMRVINADAVPSHIPSAPASNQATGTMSVKKILPERYFNNPREEMLDLVPADRRRVLEVGCANGRFASLIKQRQPAEVWGIELDAEAAQAARERVDRVFQGDVHTILPGLPDSHFDCIICNDVLEHLPDPEVVVSALAAKLAPGGLVIASIPNVRYLPVLYELLAWRDFKYRDWGVLDRTHLRFFTRKSIRRMFREAGYEVLAMHGIQMPNLPTGYRVAFLLTEIFTLGYYNDCRYIQFGCVARRAERK